MPITLDQLARRISPAALADVKRQMGATGAAPAHLVSAKSEKPAGKVRGREESQTERDFAVECLPTLVAELGLIDVRSNHTTEFSKGGTWLDLATRCRYKPDYLAAQRVDGGEDGMSFDRDVYIEVKGGDSRHGIHEDSRIKFKMATIKFPSALFVWAVRKKKGAPWRCEVWQDGERIQTVKA